MSSRDFQAGQIRVAKLIASRSGELGSSSPSLLIYSASHASNLGGGLSDSNMLSGVGPDVFLFVSGNKNAEAFSPPGRAGLEGGTTLFGGDVVVSGTFYADKMVVELDQTTTGSMFVSGNLVVSASTTLYQGLVVNEGGGAHSSHDFRVESDGEDEALFVDASANTLYINKGESAFTTQIHNTQDVVLSVGSSGLTINEDSNSTVDFRVETNNKTHALFVDASTDQVILGSGSAVSNADVFFFVSGTQGSAKTGQRGASLFGGDLVVSGALYASSSQSGGKIELIAGGDDGTNNPMVKIEANKQSDTGVDYAMQLKSERGMMHFDAGNAVATSGMKFEAGGRGVEWDIDGTVATNPVFTVIVGESTHAQSVSLKTSDGGILIQTEGDGKKTHIDTNTSKELDSIHLDSAAGGIKLDLNDSSHKIHLDSESTADHSIHLDTKGGILFDGLDHDHHTSGSMGSDTFLYVSGGIGDRGTTKRSVSVFGGDLLTSGSVWLGLGKETVSAGDASFYVSGAIGGRNSTETTGSLYDDGIAVFGGDVYISGSIIAGYDSNDGGIEATLIRQPGNNSNKVSLQTDDIIDVILGGYSYVKAANTVPEVAINDGSQDIDFRVESNTDDRALHVDAGNDRVSMFAGTGATVTDPAPTADSVFYVSGAIEDNKAVVFGGDTFISGVLKVGGENFHPLIGDYVGGTISGSIHVTSGGLPYIVAGANVTVTSASNGQITIGSSGGGSGTVTSGSFNDRNAHYITTASLSIAGGLGMTQRASDVSPEGFFFVSGSVSATDDSDFAVSIFGGDTTVSGTLKVGGADFHYLAGASSGGTISGSIHHTSGGLSYIQGGSNVTVTSASNGQITITGAGSVGTTGTPANNQLAIWTNESTLEGVNGLQWDGANLRIGGKHLGASSAGNLRFYNDGADTNGFFIIRQADESSAASSSAAILQNRSGSIIFGIGTGSLGGVGHSFTITEMGDANNRCFFIASGSENGQILLLSGGNGNSPNVVDHGDVSFHVSGAIGSANASSGGGTSVFGGDVVTSGTIYALASDAGQPAAAFGATDGTGIGVDAHMWISGAIDSKGTAVRGTSIFGGDVAISGGLYLEERSAPGDIPDGTLVLYGKDSSGVTKLYFKNEDGEVEVGSGGSSSGGEEGWIAAANNIISTTGSVYVGTPNNANPDIILGSDGSAVFNEQGASVDFRIETNNKPNALFIDGSTDQVLILSGGGATSYNEAAGADVNFYVSGTAGSRGTSARGTTVFGGDTVISGALYVSTPGAGQDVIFYGEDSSAIGLQWDADGAEHGTLVLGQNDHGVDFQVYGETSGRYMWWDQSSDTLAVSGKFTTTNGDTTFNESSGDYDFRVESNNKTHAIFVDGGTDQLVFGDNSTIGSDSFVFVSGAIGNMGLANTFGAVTLGGDMQVSGTVCLGRATNEAANGFKNLHLGVGPNALSLAYATSDVAILLSGTIASKDSSSHRGVTVAGGDLVVSGASYFEQNITLQGDILPDSDVSRNLGSDDKRFKNIYTGDLHLRNERGDWTILEEEDYLCVINNKSGKKFRMVLDPIDD